METIDDRLNRFIEQYGIRFELRAVNSDNETIGKYTSELGATDVSGYAGLLDEKVLQLAIANGDESGFEVESE